MVLNLSSIIKGLLPFGLVLLAGSVSGQEYYGLRVGADLSKIIRSSLQEGYQGIELFGDIRFRRKSRISVELGNESFENSEAIENIKLYDYSIKGSYLKAGIDWEIYDRKKGERNEIMAGMRLAQARFESDLGEIYLYDTQQASTQGAFELFSADGPKTEGLNASYLETVLSFKTHLAKSIYLGGSFRMGILLSQSQPTNFSTPWIPGFNQVTEGAPFGFSYTYGISYFIPIKKQKN